MAEKEFVAGATFQAGDVVGGATLTEFAAQTLTERARFLQPRTIAPTTDKEVSDVTDDRAGALLPKPLTEESFKLEPERVSAFEAEEARRLGLARAQIGMDFDRLKAEQIARGEFKQAAGQAFFGKTVGLGASNVAFGILENMEVASQKRIDGLRKERELALSRVDVESADRLRIKIDQEEQRIDRIQTRLFDSKMQLAEAQFRFEAPERKTLEDIRNLAFENPELNITQEDINTAVAGDYTSILTKLRDAPPSLKETLELTKLQADIELTRAQTIKALRPTGAQPPGYVSPEVWSIALGLVREGITDISDISEVDIPANLFGDVSLAISQIGTLDSNIDDAAYYLSSLRSVNELTDEEWRDTINSIVNTFGEDRESVEKSIQDLMRSNYGTI